MSTITPPPFRDPLRHELAEIRRNWVAFLVLGILTIVLGVVMIAAPLVSTMTSVWLLGALLFVGGVFQFVGAFWARRWSGFILGLLTGVLYVAVGALIFIDPVDAAAGLTLLIAAFLIVGGIFRIVAAVAIRFEHWVWPLVSGVLALVLGVLIWRQWPSSSFWVIGLFLGLEILFSGWTWVMLALGLKSLVPKAPPEDAIDVV